MSGKGYKKENANRQHLITAKVCCVVHLFVISLLQARSVGRSEKRAGEERGQGENRRRAPTDRASLEQVVMIRS